MIPTLVAVFLIGTATPPQQLLDELRLAVASGSEPKVLSHFARPEDARYLFRMAGATGGLRRLKVAVFPAPQGWGSAPFWAVFHTFQEIEAHHNPVYEVVPTMDGLIVGKEIPEAAADFNRIVHADVEAKIYEDKRQIWVRSNLDLEAKGAGKATVLRLNDVYRLTSATIDGKTANIVRATDQSVPEVKEGEVIQAGSLLIPWTKTAPSELAFDYVGTVDTSGHDKVTPKMAYLTAWWVPSTARLPHTTRVKVEGPAEWEIRSEGILKERKVSGTRQTVTYQCDLPISYPKIVGGKYRLAASTTDRGRLLRAYQFDPVDAGKGKRTVELAKNAIAWFEDNLAPFPFPGYDVFDAEGYYGIESYSYTLLEKSITNRFVGHEIGHTYFGGMAPSAYVQDSWNESVTQYVDSVLYGNNADRSLQNAFQSLGLQIPLSAMAEPHDWGSQSYYRGAFVMRMLEREIGKDAMMAGLKVLVTQRRGMDTTWKDLRPVFEKTSGKTLDWFWRQWIDGTVFPNLEIVRWNTERWNDRLQSRVTVRQTGTPLPYRLRFRVRLTRGGAEQIQEVTMDSPEAVFSVPVGFEPTVASLDVLGYAFVRVKS